MKTMLVPIVFGFTVLVILGGCGAIAENVKSHELAKRLRYLESMEHFSSPSFEYEDFWNVARLVSHGGAAVSSVPQMASNVRGPFVIEGNGIKYTLGDSAIWDRQVAFIEPGTYIMTTWIQPAIYYECKLLTGGWERCARPESTFTETLEWDPVTRNPYTKTTQHLTQHRVIEDNFRIRCSLDLTADERLDASYMILACWKLSEIPDLEPYPESRAPTGYVNRMKPLEAVRVTEDEVEAATQAKTSFILVPQ